MASKYLELTSSGTAEKEALVTSAGAADGGKIVALNSAGKVDETMMPDGIGADTTIAVAYENLAASNLVNLFNDGGTLKARKADASGGFAKQADGFVKTSFATGASATVYNDGTVTGLTGLTVGAKYYLSGSAAGSVSATPPTTAAYISQYVGKAKSATELIFEQGEPILRV